MRTYKTSEYMLFRERLIDRAPLELCGFDLSYLRQLQFSRWRLRDGTITLKGGPRHCDSQRESRSPWFQDCGSCLQTGSGFAGHYISFTPSTNAFSLRLREG